MARGGKRQGSGQKKIPVELQKAKGTYRSHRDNSEIDSIKALLFVNEQLPLPPEELNENEKRYWMGAMVEFGRVHGWVAHSDLFMLKRWCVNAALLDRLDLKCNDADEIIYNAAGNEVVNPVFKLRESTEKTFRSLCSEFGLSPSSRTNIKLAQQEKEEEQEDEFQI